MVITVTKLTKKATARFALGLRLFTVFLYRRRSAGSYSPLRANDRIGAQAAPASATGVESAVRRRFRALRGQKKRPKKGRVSHFDSVSVVASPEPLGRPGGNNQFELLAALMLDKAVGTAMPSKMPKLALSVLISQPCIRLSP